MQHGRHLAHGAAGSSRARRYRTEVLSGATIWQQLDFSQELGSGDDSYGHDGCVNALCWSDDGGVLLSGSDDRRICMWTPDADTAPTASMPHPFKLSDAIVTGHRANIFSTKFLPHASHPTIVSCAGDSQIRVFDVERLPKLTTGSPTHPRIELDGRSGDAVRILRCHTDRAKRISVEDNPHVFLSVSEDGTVRQHDLRTTHSCRSGCPDPLMEAPGHISLYTLSVSPLQPYLFTVAGTSPYAYLQDRRMARVARKEWAVPGWTWRDQESKVQRVRRFGLRPEEVASSEEVEEEQAGTAQPRRRAARARVRRSRTVGHITAVEMSKDNAEELIASFEGHSVALYNIHDSPPETSARATSSSFSATSSKRKRQRSSSPKARDTATTSQLAEQEARLGPRPASLSEAPARAGPEGGLTEDDPHATSSATAGGARQQAGDGINSDDWMDIEEDEIEGNSNAGERRPITAADLLQSSTSSGDDVGELLSDGEEEEEDEDMVEWMARDEHVADELFNTVPYVYQRQNYRGAKNVQTVKDVTFLGVRSDKVCSGSDDGNWFVWDKTTGRLDGIWKGDDQVVNVIEQHPSLPLVATSGIDSTVKIFSPQTNARMPSWRRIDQAEDIIRANTAEVPDRMPGVFSRSAMIQYYLRALAAREAESGGPNEEGGEGVQECRMQ